MSQKKFISLLEDPHAFIVTSPRKSRAVPTVIKGERNEGNMQIHQFVPEEFEEEQIRITMIEEDGEVLGLTFECPCGRRATVHLEREE